MKDSNPNWEEMINKMSSNKKNPNPADAVGSFILSLAVFTSIGGLMLMLLNMAFNKAWPNVDTFTPAVGYGEACLLFLAFWGFMTLRAILSMAFQANLNRSNK